MRCQARPHSMLCFAALSATVLIGCEPRVDDGPADASSVGVASARARAPTHNCSTHCIMGGLCNWDAEQSRCVAASDEACAASNVCKTSGHCEKVQDSCSNTRAGHCSSSQRCASDGLCTFVGPGRPCRARGDDCRASDGCRRKGRCSAIRGRCQVADDADCASSTMCATFGLCSAAPSRDSHASGRACAALSNDDCAKGAECTERGLCTAASGTCR